MGLAEGRPIRSRSDGVMHKASSVARQWIGQGMLALNDSWTGYGRPAMSGVRMGHGTDRDGISILRLTFDSKIFLTDAILLLTVGTLSASAFSAGLGSADIVT